MASSPVQQIPQAIPLQSEFRLSEVDPSHLPRQGVNEEGIRAGEAVPAITVLATASTDGDDSGGGDSVRLAGHGWSAPDVRDGETFIQCLCGYVAGDRHAPLPIECPIDVWERWRNDQLSMVHVQVAAAIDRKWRSQQADAERYRRALGSR